MAAKMMPGGPVADAVFEDLVPRSEKLIENGHTPGLGTILVGDDGASARYVGRWVKAWLPAKPTSMPNGRAATCG